VGIRGTALIRLHDLRHTTATLLNGPGVLVRDTMESLGHSRVTVTLEACTDADEASRREVIERLNMLSYDGAPHEVLLSALLSLDENARLVAGRRACELGGRYKI
jgi:hypothetical protein